MIDILDSLVWWDKNFTCLDELKALCLAKPGTAYQLTYTVHMVKHSGASISGRYGKTGQSWGKDECS